MVRGFDIFRKHFGPFNDQFILIGGVACDVLHEAVGLGFRTTKDIDLVLCLENLMSEFTRAIWDFIRDGGYEVRERTDGSPVRYRFSRPAKPDYPAVIELFSPRPVTLAGGEEQRIVPVRPSADASGLSAILIEPRYYNLLRAHTVESGGIRVASSECLILLKAKAFVDLRRRKAAGERLDEDDVRKHKMDVFRLYRLLDGEKTVVVEASVQNDMREFVRLVNAEDVDLQHIITTMEKSSILQDLLRIFVLGPSQSDVRGGGR